MNWPTVVAIAIAATLLALVFISFAWRWACRVWSLPCPSLFAFALESRFFFRLTGTAKTLDRIGFRPGQRVLEIGPGPGRLLLPAAERVLPGGEVVGVDIQPSMLARLKHRTKSAGITNLTAFLGDATQLALPDASFDLVFMVTVLGEVPDRSAILKQVYRVLKPGGILSISEMFGDPHYQTKGTVVRFAEAAGFRLQSITGGFVIFTANFARD